MGVHGVGCIDDNGDCGDGDDESCGRVIID